MLSENAANQKRKKNTMAKTETKTPRAPRVPRELTALEKEAKQQFLDAKALGKILPAIDKLGLWGRDKLKQHILEPGSDTMS